MLTINTEYRNGILFARLKGNLNKDSISKFNKNVINKIIDGGICNVVFNVYDLKEIDINGINALLYSYRLCKRKDGCTLLCGNNDRIKKKVKRSRILNYILEISNELTATKIIKMRVR